MSRDLLESLFLSFWICQLYLVAVGALTLVAFLAGYGTTIVEWLYVPIIAPALLIRSLGLTTFGDGSLAFFFGFFIDVVLIGFAIWAVSNVRLKRNR